MEKKEKSKWKARTVIVLVTLLIIISFVVGTTFGFDKAIESLSKCEEVSCSEIGAGNATYCEICPDNGYKIKKIT